MDLIASLTLGEAVFLAVLGGEAARAIPCVLALAPPLTVEQPFLETTRQPVQR